MCALVVPALVKVNYDVLAVALTGDKGKYWSALAQPLPKLKLGQAKEAIIIARFFFFSCCCSNNQKSN